MGQLSCFLSYANQYTKPFNEISSVVTELQNALACARRVFDFIEEQQEEPDAASAIELKNPDGSMTLEHVSFSYNPEIKFAGSEPEGKAGPENCDCRTDGMWKDDADQSFDAVL